MKAEVTQSDEPTELFTGSITIRSLPANPDPTKQVMAAVDINSNGTATGYGRALGCAARAFIEHLPDEHQVAAVTNMLQGFFEVLSPGGAHEVKHGGLHS